MSTQQDKNVYILDTNTLIGFSIWIPIDLNKNFWKKLEESLSEEKWILLDVVANEIKKENDGLKKWCVKQKERGLQKNIGDNHRNRAVEINNTWKMIDDTTGKSTTDTYVIAYAEDKQLAVFSREHPRTNDTELFKIPDVCKQLNIPIIFRPKEFLIAIGFNN